MSTTVTTVNQLREYIREMLGEPIIQVEVTDAQINRAISLAVQKFSDFAMGGETPSHYAIDTLPGVTEYILDERVQAITKVRTRSNTFNFQLPGAMILTPSDVAVMTQGSMGSLDIGAMSAVLAQISMIEKMFDVEPYWSFNSNSKILTLHDKLNVQGYNKILIEAYVSYAPKDNDYIYNHQWVKDYATALTKKIWGSNTGKYNTQLIGGATINYDRILQEASAEIEKLEGELLTKWTAPLGIYRA